MLVIGDWVELAIRRHAESCYPFECGGLLWGTESDGTRRIVDSCPLRNQSAQPQRRILLDPLEIHRADQQAQRSGLGVWGFYHSHPDQVATPSAADLEGAAYSLWSYLIVAVWEGRAEALRSWILQEDRESFREEKIEIVTRSY